MQAQEPLRTSAFTLAGTQRPGEIDGSKLFNTCSPLLVTQEEAWRGLIAAWSQISSPDAAYCRNRLLSPQCRNDWRSDAITSVQCSIKISGWTHKQKLSGNGSTYPVWPLPPPLPPQSALVFISSRPVKKDRLKLTFTQASSHMGSIMGINNGTDVHVANIQW